MGGIVEADIVGTCRALQARLKAVSRSVGEVALEDLLARAREPPMRRDHYTILAEIDREAKRHVQSPFCEDSMISQSESDGGSRMSGDGVYRLIAALQLPRYKSPTSNIEAYAKCAFEIYTITAMHIQVPTKKDANPGPVR